MDNQTWASALGRVKGTLSRWPIVMLPVILILSHYPEPWGSLCALSSVAFAVGMSTYYMVKIRRKLIEQEKAYEAWRVERECRIELFEMTKQMDDLVAQYQKNLSDGKPADAAECREAWSKIRDAQQRTLARWKSSETSDTK